MFYLKTTPNEQPGYQLRDASSSREFDQENRFLRMIELRALSLRTVRAYGYDLLYMNRWLQDSGKFLVELKQADLIECIAYQKIMGAKPSSINRRLSTIQLFYFFCTGQSLPHSAGVAYPVSHYRGSGYDRELGIFQFRKSSRLKLRVQLPHTLIEPLKSAEVDLFLTEMTRYRDLAIVLLMLLCGLRSCEVLQLQLSSIQFLEHRFSVIGKGNRERIVPLPPQIIAVMEKYLLLERPAVCTTPQFFVILQGQGRGDPMSISGLRSLFRYRCHLLKLPQAHPHRFRHTFGADMARAGVGLPVLQRLMGHADSSTTLKYICLSIEDIADEYKKAMERIEKRYEATQT